LRDEEWRTQKKLGLQEDLAVVTARKTGRLWQALRGSNASVTHAQNVACLTSAVSRKEFGNARNAAQNSPGLPIILLPKLYLRKNEIYQ
jgi:hypothetical protein